ncbi:MAG: hypothetical protein M1828_003854 [Chrysothrix sp. TS-e1954]|nr:MAG: hypothetical protein M1828_003854 [Chrysothrix sp. TS-e1954]
MELLAIAGGVETALGIARGINKYIDDCRSAKQDLRDLAHQIDLTYLSCGDLQKQLELHQTRPRWDENQVNYARKCVYQCDHLLKRLTDLFLKRNANADPRNIDEKFDPSFWQKISWSLLKHESYGLKLELMLVKIDIGHALIMHAGSDFPRSVNSHSRGGHVDSEYQHQRKKILKKLYAFKEQDVASTNDDGADDDATGDSTTLQAASSRAASRHENDTKEGIEQSVKDLEDLLRKQLDLDQRDAAERLEAQKDREDEIKRKYQQAKVAEARDYFSRMKSARTSIAQTLEKDNVSVADRDKLLDDLVKQSQPGLEVDEYLKAAIPEAFSGRLD